MINIDIQKLVQALDSRCRADLESAAQHCVARSAGKVAVEDLLLMLLERPDSLLKLALQDAGVSNEDMTAQLQSGSGNDSARSPVFSLELVQWLQDALLVANLELGRTEVDQAALLLGLLRNPLRHAGTRYQSLISRINAERLTDFIAAAQQQGATQPAASNTEQASLLQRFTHNLTQQARDGKLDPVLCRDESIRQMIDILARRRKNNPIVVGEAGVGKTAIVEGLALRIAAGEVPEVLLHAELLALDLGLLQAGASVKGEFERRLQGVIDAVKTHVKPVILFIDEAHTLIGAGAQAGGSDAANLLKPALARGELRTIAATTWSEYKKYFEKDPALTRRFQPVQLLEPTTAEAVTILRGLAPLYERSHGVYLRDDAVVAAAELSARYLTGRQLPDKAVDVLDTACARVRINLASAPQAIERLRTSIAERQRQQLAMQRDLEAGLALDPAAFDALQIQLEEDEAELGALTREWDSQRALASELMDLRKRCAERRAAAQTTEQSDNESNSPLESTDTAEDPQQANPEQRLQALQAQISALPAEQRLVSHEVCPRLVAEVISHWTGVPLSQLAREHNDKVSRFADDLRLRVRGQEQAVQAIDRAVRATAAGLNNLPAPAGVFLLVGPSGVGKTETALALADLLYGGERFLTTINMSEFQEKHSVSRLLGAPPGYVGYGEGGMLTEAVRQKPYSVVLLDEVEKADPDVLNVFYQIFDKGVANDGEGREINFRNTLILMTSNLASEQIIQLCAGDQRPQPEELEQAIRPTLSRHFKPALLARMRVVPYFPVDGEVLHELTTLKLQRFGQRLERRQLGFSHCAALVTHLAERCRDTASGARLIDQLIDQHLQPQVVDRVLDAMASGVALSHVHATLDGQGALVCEFA
ncbi:MAG: type VI secretion system ATPase TssH [Gammaproteobacteria bacterium HGW-Gammaproteobacteria-11]|nr:MAG: type VI secretion system ATPase TssH [Gammaproteobacteria bacterium HGW-Gammaproteobacteria-11]